MKPAPACCRRRWRSEVSRAKPGLAADAERLDGDPAYLAGLAPWLGAA